MPRFQFALSTAESLPQAGVVQSESFAEALTAVGEHVSAGFGDILEIGVTGFPPARYECLGASRGGTRRWRPAGQLAA
jgi:hypothetical protein